MSLPKRCYEFNVRQFSRNKFRIALLDDVLAYNIIVYIELIIYAYLSIKMVYVKTMKKTLGVMVRKKIKIK